MDFDARCDNATLATVRCVPVLDRRGADLLVVVAKVAYRFDELGTLALDAAPVRLVQSIDVGGSLRYPDDVAEEKPGTDVGLVGTAIPPAGAGRTEMLAWLQVGGARKVVRVSGPRTYVSSHRGPVPGPPGPLGPTPLRYDLAFGGTDPSTPEDASAHPANPIGRGFAKHPDALIGRPAPLLEIVAQPPSAVPLDEAPADPAHAAFGPLAPHWEPRRSRAGTHDAAWARARAPVRPLDFDVRHHLWSAPDLWQRTPLVGDEPIEIGGTSERPIRLKLPRYEPRFEAVVDGSRRELATHLDGLLFDTDERRVELTWRATVPLPRKWQRVGALRVSTLEALPPDVVDRELPPPPRQEAHAR